MGLTAYVFLCSYRIKRGIARFLHTLSAADVSNQSTTCKPRIILIGWLGAQERHFNKYAFWWLTAAQVNAWMSMWSFTVPRMLSSSIPKALAERQQHPAIAG